MEYMQRFFNNYTGIAAEKLTAIPVFMLHAKA